MLLAFLICKPIRYWNESLEWEISGLARLERRAQRGRHTPGSGCRSYLF